MQHRHRRPLRCRERQRRTTAAGLAIVGAVSKSPLRGHGRRLHVHGELWSVVVKWTRQGYIPHSPHLIGHTPPTNSWAWEARRRTREDAVCHPGHANLAIFGSSRTPRPRICSTVVAVVTARFVHHISHCSIILWTYISSSQFKSYPEWPWIGEQEFTLAMFWLSRNDLIAKTAYYIIWSTKYKINNI
jgi:hypothetical protein